MVGCEWGRRGWCARPGGHTAIGAARDAVVDFAEGAWTCDVAFAEGYPAGQNEWTAEAVIKANDGNSGEFAVSIGSSAPESEVEIAFQGEWHLDGPDLEIVMLEQTFTVTQDGSVETYPIDESDLARYAVAGTSLQTRGIEILTVDEGHDPLSVDIARDGDTVEFSWADDLGDESAMTCVKA